MIHVTDLRPWFTESIKENNFINGVWLFEDDKKRQLVIKLGCAMSRSARAAYMQMIALSLMNAAADEDEKAGGKSEFGDVIDGMQLREWCRADDEIIKNGIPHEIIKGDKA